MRVAIVGAGISGLTAGYRLQQAGHEVAVFEREGRVGGRMTSVMAGGFCVDVGAHLLLDNFERVKGLAAEVGLADDWMALEAGDEGGILRDHNLHGFTPAGAYDVLRYRGLSLVSRVRLVRFFLQAHRWRNDLDFFDLSVGDDELDTVDAYRYACEHFGRETADYLIDPFVRTFHFHGAHRLSMKYFDALAALLLSEGGFSPHAFRGHMVALPEALAARLDVRLDTLVAEVKPSPRDVVVVAGHGRERFDAVVLATTAPVAADLLHSPTPAQRELLDAVQYSCTVMATFRVPLAVAGDFEGIWVPFAESSIISGCANETCKGSSDGTHCVLSMGVHEEAAEGLIAREDGAVADALIREWTRLFPAYADALKPLHVHRWAHAMPVYEVGFLSRVRRFWEHGQGDGGVWLCGDYLNHPWVEGSVRCGEKVADAIG